MLGTTTYNPILPQALYIALKELNWNCPTWKVMFLSETK